MGILQTENCMSKFSIASRGSEKEKSRKIGKKQLVLSA
jgi:hypothetical protein